LANLKKPIWDESQLEIIDAPPAARLLVEAGPGTGKTAVACARIAHLVDQQRIPASKIWLFSFTRTAVKEIRDRIITFMSRQQDAATVKITTLDSQVWYMRQGFEASDVKNLLGSYEANIRGMTDLLKREDEGLLQYLSEIRHIIIDEAQDLVGVRAELVCELSQKASGACGITVFTDSAQAIYGFTTEFGSGSRNNRLEAVPALRSGAYGDFEAKTLRQIYRTSDEKLALHYQSLRDVVLNDEIQGGEKLNQIREVVGQISTSDLSMATEQELDGRDDVLLLYRTRAQVLRASSFLWGDGVPHKLRMGGLPLRLAPWIARVFFDVTERTVSEERFADIWQKRVAPYGEPFNNHLASESWANLKRQCATRRGKVEIKELRKLLSRERPPIEFLLPEEFLPGPIVGTIHASKGREADEVRLMIGDNSADDDAHAEQLDEEGRVVFVGATRARERLMVGRSYKTWSSALDASGRIFKPGRKNKSPRAQIEFGLQNDLDIHSGLMADEWEDPQVPLDNQEFLWNNCLGHVPVYAECSAETDWKYWLHSSEDEADWIGSFNETVNWQLFDIAKIIAQKRGLGRLKPGSRINHLNMIGSMSIVLPPDDDKRSGLIEPFNRSGIFLAPFVSGFCPVFYFKY
jgi:hypothetical protein